MRREPDIRSRSLTTAGYSLPEMIIVLAISMVMLLVAIALYQRAARRQVLLNDAVQLAARLEQVKSQARATNIEHRLVFDQLSSSFTAQVFRRDSGNWQAAIAISAEPLRIAVNSKFEAPAFAYTPPYRTTVTAIIAALPEAPLAPAGPVAIQFNTRGFPVHPTDSEPDAGNLRAANEIYLTDGLDYYAITVNMLGQVEVWNFDNALEWWMKLSR